MTYILLSDLEFVFIELETLFLSSTFLHIDFQFYNVTCFKTCFYRIGILIYKKNKKKTKKNTHDYLAISAKSVFRRQTSLLRWRSNVRR